MIINITRFSDKAGAHCGNDGNACSGLKIQQTSFLAPSQISAAKKIRLVLLCQQE